MSSTAGPGFAGLAGLAGLSAPPLGAPVPELPFAEPESEPELLPPVDGVVRSAPSDPDAAEPLSPALPLPGLAGDPELPYPEPDPGPPGAELPPPIAPSDAAAPSSGTNSTSPVGATASPEDAGRCTAT
ncbi:hypothetical protein [Streptomyces umbrinus]|uniref:hypothetical protein n=1 Tax=Streptomyces umbrinus TaxID=67370 RepID=UPI0027D8F892|nr:hypothetical protein [Streptomyces umbrinus]